MQQGRDIEAQKCYEMALSSNDIRTIRSANKNLGFVHLWRGEWEEGWKHHGKRFDGQDFTKNQWSGDPLNGEPLLIWNDVGMGDIFQFIRYTKLLVERGEKIVLAVDSSQIDFIYRYLNWPLHKIIDRDEVMPIDYSSRHIPLMSLIPILDKNTRWGREWECLTWKRTNNINTNEKTIGICWASNPADQTMYRYKSTDAKKMLEIISMNNNGPNPKLISLQTDEKETHKKLNLVQARKDWEDTYKKAIRTSVVHSVDTAVAHLAAGAGVPVKLHLKSVFDWRWKGNGRKWYKSIDLLTESSG